VEEKMKRSLKLSWRLWVLCGVFATAFVLGTSGVAFAGPGGGGDCQPSELSETGDFDEDGVCDVDDNCARVPNADQLDSNGDTVGDVCQCGDADGSGDLNVADTRVISRCANGAIPCDQLPLCDANGDGVCDVGDRRVVSRCINGGFSCTLLTCAQKDG
jgi:hypothetical protein